MSDTQSDLILKIEQLRLNNTTLLGYAIAGIFKIKTGGYYAPHNIEVDSFELSFNGEIYAGGSFYVDNNHLILASVTPQKDLGDLSDWENVKRNIANL